MTKGGLEMPDASEKDTAVTKPANGKVGFALGGLGGFNAYGVGFLQAARQLQVMPDIITCTSGMIAWASRWLDGEDLEPLILEKCEQDTKFPPSLGWLNMLSVALLGSSGIARAALPEYLARLLTPLTTREELSEQVLDRLLPARVWAPCDGMRTWSTSPTCSTRARSRSRSTPFI